MELARQNGLVTRLGQVATAGLLTIVTLVGCDLVVRNEPDVNVQRLAQDWPPYQQPVVDTADPKPARENPDAGLTSSQPTAAVVEATPPRRRLIPIRRAEDWDLPETAMDSLGRIGAPAVPALVEALDHRDPIRRLQAAKVLARIGPEAQQSVTALVNALRDENESVRKAAARALGQIGPAAEDAVIPLLDLIEQQPPAATTSSSGPVQPQFLPASATTPLE